MKRKRVLAIFIFFLFILLLIGLANHSMLFLPKEELIFQSYSPKNDYRVDTFLNHGNATVSYSITADVINIKKQTTRTFYYCYREKTVEIVWIDDYTVNINGRILDIRYDSYNSKWE